jgi:hypothetical protein
MSTETKEFGSSGLQEYVDQFEHGHPEAVSEKVKGEGSSFSLSEGQSNGLSSGLSEYVSQFGSGPDGDSEKVAAKSSDAPSEGHHSSFGAGLQEYVSQFEHGSQPESEKVAPK